MLMTAKNTRNAVVEMSSLRNMDDDWTREIHP
jgi:hypothetical protein